MKQKKLVFNFFVNRNWKKLTDSRKRAKILADNRKGHHPIETLGSGGMPPAENFETKRLRNALVNIFPGIFLQKSQSRASVEVHFFIA